MDNENWLQIKGYEGLYEISDCGRVKSLPKNRYNLISSNSEMILKFDIMNGYYHVTLFSNKTRVKISVHRLVASHFVENKLGNPCVHHIDHDKSNNHKDNLTWVTYSENIKYNYTTGGQIGKTNMKGKFGENHPLSKKVIQLDLIGNKIKEFIGISEAARYVNGSASHIVSVCKGKLKKHKGFKWQYA